MYQGNGEMSLGITTKSTIWNHYLIDLQNHSTHNQMYIKWKILYNCKDFDIRPLACEQRVKGRGKEKQRKIRCEKWRTPPGRGHGRAWEGKGGFMRGLLFRKRDSTQEVKAIRWQEKSGCNRTKQKQCSDQPWKKAISKVVRESLGTKLAFMNWSLATTSDISVSQWLVV